MTQSKDRKLSCFIKQGRKQFSVKRNLLIQSKRTYVRVKKEIKKFCNKLSMKTNLLVAFNRNKYDLNYKSHIYKIKTMTNYEKLLQIPI